ncbi:MAG: complex I NDUFA9 subunit family protein [archaeon]
MHVLVTGGTGFIGTYLCNELADRGHDVTALARTPDGTDLVEDVATAVGDVTAYDSIDGAFEGQDAVVNLVSLSPLFKPRGGDEAHFEVHLGGTENVVRAARAHGVDRIVQMSGLGADPNGPTSFLRAKGQAEEVVRESSLDWIIVRPSVVFGEGDEFVGFTKKLTPPGIAALPGGGKTRFQPIWVGDLVPMLADAVEDDAHVGETYDIGGPEKLTLKEVANLVRGRVAVIPIPMVLAGVGLTVAGAIPGFPMGRDQYRSLGVDNTTADNDVEAFGVDPSDLRTLSAYLKGR